MLLKHDILTLEQVKIIHEESIRILNEIGVEFLYEPAIKVFKKMGQKINGNRVYFERSFIEKMLEKAPSQFTLHARNPENNLVCGGENIIFAPCYGAPFIHEIDGTRRDSTMNDYDNLVKLAGASKNIHMTGGNVVEPNDIDENIRHLKMVYSNIINSDKCFMGSSSGYDRANDTIEMAALLFGGREIIKEKPALICLINSITPLKYDDRMLGALMAYAEAGQAMIISSLVMAGTTGPATIAGSLALQNAEVLAGIILAQSINPGTPVVYGSTSAISDMAEASLSIGNPECALFVSASAQLARFYGLPSRGGGGLSDSKLADAQAGYESMMTLMAAGTTGINFVLHAAGILEFYNAVSYEKFMVDDEIAGMVLRYIRGINFSEEKLAFEVINQVGPGGHFLCEEHTLENYKSESRRAKLSDRKSYGLWSLNKHDAKKRAKESWENILSSYKAPKLDTKINDSLLRFMDNRSKGYKVKR